jgi:hypothetical protein
MSYPLFHDGAMKRYKTHYPRRSLLSVPYSVRPDRIERGLRILRALRFSIAAAAAPVSRPHQHEFDFIASKRAPLPHGKMTPKECSAVDSLPHNQ